MLGLGKRSNTAKPGCTHQWSSVVCMGIEDELCLKPVTRIVSELREGKIRTEELTSYLAEKVERVDRRVHAYTVLNTLLLAALSEGRPHCTQHPTHCVVYPWL